MTKHKAATVGLTDGELKHLQASSQILLGFMNRLEECPEARLSFTEANELSSIGAFLDLIVGLGRGVDPETRIN